MCSDLIAPIIIKFANASIHSKCFASDWKLSRVTPIYKGKGGANDKGNYRPISVTVVPATAGPLGERPPALAGHFCDVPTTLPC